MDTFYYLSLIALIAALLKIAILAQVVNRSKLTSAFMLVTLILILQNLTEFLIFFTFGLSDQLSYFLLGIFLVLVALLTVAQVNLVLTVAEAPKIKLYLYFFGAIAIAVIYFALNGNLYLGIESNGYSLIAITGSAYIVFQALLLAMVAICTFWLWRGSTSSNVKIAHRSRLTMFAAIPIFVTVLFVTILKLAGIGASSGGVTPLASTFFVWILMHDERGDFVVFRLKWIQFWFYSRLALKIAFSKDSLSMKEFKEETEKTILLEALKLCDYNMSAAARILETSHSSVSRKVKKYRYEDPSNKTLSKIIEQTQE
ncbi:MAG: hypothetical protein GKR91_11955 [Pseudomonadales bacterium]|nr:hypothetical protein [Pseudomonadales bacterium]